MNQDQIDSITRTACKIIGGILAAHGAQQMAATINAPDVVELIGGVVTTIVGIYASHKSNSSTPTTAPSTTQPKPPIT
jgi:hypothetical protein